MTNFTPGPYLFEKQHCGKYLVLAERPNKCPIEVAECFSEPNARLFAAAPEILKLLYQAHEEMASIVEYNDLYIDDEKTAARICRNIEAVIQQIDGDAKEALTERIDAILDRIKGEDDDDA